MLAAGTLLDKRYEILAPLAAGGMGEVYRARRVLLGDEVAIKVILPKTDHADILRERFLRESRTCAQLRHPHIVSILDFDVDADGRPFLVMEYLNGPSLRDELKRLQRMELDVVRSLVQDLAGALQLAHDRGVVHRDLKPANVVSHRFDTGEIVFKLIDFGIANLRESEETQLTGRREFLGTVHYASPEQLRGEPVDGRSDVYSLGAMTFELLTGRPPFSDADPLTLAMQHLTVAPPAPSSLLAGVPPWVDVVVLKALAKDRQDRWDSPLAFARALRPQGDERTEVAASRVSTARWMQQYEIRERLGSGRFGSEIFAGIHRAMGHPVAIRTLARRSDANWEVARSRFLREAQALQLSHPSVIQVRDYGEEGDVLYVVTELIEGASLRQVLVEQGSLPWSRLSRLAAQLLSAAAAIHKRGGLVSGLTPDIVRIATDDDGERIMVSSGGVCHVQDVMALLSDTTVRGTGVPEPELFYVAPEVLLGESTDAQADVFTIGALIYEMATGRRPFEATSLPLLLGAMLRTTPADPRSVQADVPESAALALLSALSPDRQIRPASVSEFKATIAL
ncbi:MAG: serine/threonine-protein kinase [Vicinamibacterales bacterium]